MTVDRRPQPQYAQFALCARPRKRGGTTAFGADRPGADRP